MLIRISLIIAILAAVAVGVLNFVKVKEKIETLITERNDWHAKFDATDAELTRTKGELDKTTKDLNQTKQALADMTTERDSAKAEMEAATRRATELSDNLAKTTRERDDARADLFAYKSTGFTADQIAGLGKQIKQLNEAIEVANEEKKILERNVAKLEARLAIYEESPPVTAPASLLGSVAVTDPKWDFVVLDVGEEQGVRENCELLVSRNGKLVAKVMVRSVQKDRSIANVMPGWKIADVVEGDKVVAAHPAS